MSLATRSSASWSSACRLSKFSISMTSWTLGLGPAAASAAFSGAKFSAAAWAFAASTWGWGSSAGTLFGPCWIGSWIVLKYVDDFLKIGDGSWIGQCCTCQILKYCFNLRKISHVVCDSSAKTVVLQADWSSDEWSYFTFALGWWKSFEIGIKGRLEMILRRSWQWGCALDVPISRIFGKISYILIEL